MTNNINAPSGAKNWLNSTLALVRCTALRDIAPDERLILDLHLDSLEMVELISAIEEKSRRPLKDEVWMAWETIADIINYLQEFFISPTKNV
ncbi:Acyl carrier protein [Serratia quinivorans]|uniref:acyl carrier protein n=1 Tax=Serratia quinivorans TaxID=137545 RepID=UPI00217A2B75|nr:acyl carrier protein [Serratia quinivorans]CAI1902948.1 Acyl carrier protein [Serratia quinivorans]